RVRTDEVGDDHRGGDGHHDAEADPAAPVGPGRRFAARRAAGRGRFEVGSASALHVVHSTMKGNVARCGEIAGVWQRSLRDLPRFDTACEWIDLDHAGRVAFTK